MTELTRADITYLSAPHTMREDLEHDVRAGLTASPRTMPPKYFYDAVGSELFERITHLPEYYLTRAETAILERHARDVVQAIGPHELIELGSGSSRKTRLLLQAMHDAGCGDRYAPMDVSADALAVAGDALRATYPWLEFDGYVGDFHTDLHRMPRHGRRLVAFLGSTIGNLDHEARIALYAEVGRMLREDDRFLLGVDLVKDPGVLTAAYDDAQGVTAAFNRNMLTVINRELGADLPVEAFRHEAVWNEAERRIEMWLRATEDVVARFPTLDLEVRFRAGEAVRTEISCKFTRPVVLDEFAASGLRMERWLTDPEERFALVLAAPIDGAS